MKNLFIALVFIVIICNVTACENNSSESNIDIQKHSDQYQSVIVEDSIDIDKETDENDIETEVKDILDNSGEIYDNYTADSDYGEGKSSTELLFDDHGSKITDETIINNNIDIPRIEEVADNVYNKVALEVSAIASEYDYTDIEVKIEEYNINTRMLSYIVKFDDNVFYFIYVDENENIMSMADEYNIGAELWSELHS